VIKLSGKVALVTGGSVGTRLARAFLEAGCKVALVYRNPARGNELDKEFASYSGAFLPLQADLSNFKDAKSAVNSVRSKFGRIDFLLNSLGGWIGGKKLHEHTTSELQKMFSIDVVPTFNVMSQVLPVMAEGKFGRVVNFISLQVFGNGAGNSIYAASKSAVLALSKAAAEEYKNSGISVYTIAPSTIDTENNRKAMPKADTSKWVKIEEIVDATLFLCAAGDSLNGTILKFPGKL